jgi:integrase
VRDNTYHLHWDNIVDNYLIPYFGNRPLDKIKRNDLELYFIANSDLCKSTLKTHLSVLNEIFSNACDNDLIEKNPCANFKLQVGRKSSEKKIYSKEQTDLILSYSEKHRFGLGVDIMLNCGVSRSELLGIKWEDIDFENHSVFVHQSVTPRQRKCSEGESRVVIDETKNRFRTRTVALPLSTINHICTHPREIIVGENKHKHIAGKIVVPEYLIYNRYGNVCSPDVWYRRHYKTFMTDMHNFYLKKGIDIPILSAHSLRHTRASLWLNEGKSPYAIAAEMGWADFEMLNRVYGHRDIDELRKLLDI